MPGDKQIRQRDSLISNNKGFFLFYINKCSDETPDYVEKSSIFQCSIFEFNHIANLENISVKINFHSFIFKTVNT